MTRSRYEAEADLFKVLGHPIRVRLLEVLAESGQPAAELRIRVQAPAAGLSQQLSVLRRAGLVVARRDAAGIRYALTTPRVGDLLTAGRATLASVLAAQVELLADLRPPPTSARSLRPTGAGGAAGRRPTPAKR